VENVGGLGRALELGPELCELACAHELVEVLEEGHGGDERLVLRVNVVQDSSGFPEEREAEAKVGAVDGRRERLDEDVDDDVGVRELGVELVAARVSRGHCWFTHSFKMARLARRSYSPVATWVWRYSSMNERFEGL